MGIGRGVGGHTSLSRLDTGRFEDSRLLGSARSNER